jgi:hypothetical protein
MTSTATPPTMIISTRRIRPKTTSEPSSSRRKARMQGLGLAGRKRGKGDPKSAWRGLQHGAFLLAAVKTCPIPG